MADPSSHVTLHQVALHVEDLARATAFYREVVGLHWIATFDPPGLTFFDVGGTRLLLEKGAPASLLYLRVPDAAAEVERLRAAGVTIESEPHVIFTDDAGQFGPKGVAETMAFFRDSEGNLVGLASRQEAG
ncbi:MAG TPA: VOC family protein [Acidimicrobiales bacterium]|nr:VOC family protein [Acidimicrobiales bacterium]